MKQTDIKRMISGRIECYTQGRYTIQECIEQVNKVIQDNTWFIPDIDKRIAQQNKLYKFGLSNLVKGIRYTERR